MTKTILQHYLDNNFNIILCKGYHQKYNKQKDYKEGKQPVNFEPVKDINKLMSWINEDGWIAWLLPENIAVLDIDKEYSLRFIKNSPSVKDKKTLMQETKNGLHLIFEIPENVEIKNQSDVILKYGINATIKTGNGGKKGYIIVEPSEGKKWINLKEKPKQLPEILQPINRKNKNEIIKAISWQLRFGYLQKTVNGNFDIEMHFLTILLKAGYDDGYILQLFKRIFSNEFDEERTKSIITTTREKLSAGEPLTGLPSLIETAKENNLTNLETLLNMLTQLTHSEKSVNVSSTCHSDKRLINNNKNNLYDTYDTCDTLFEKDIIVDTEDFPINVYPEQIQELINDYTNGFNLSKPDIPAITLLMIVATGIGATRRIQINPGWLTYATLYIGVVASSGSKKTPILTNLLKPLTDRNTELIKKYIEQKKLYEKDKKNTEKPVLYQTVVNVATYEKLAQILRDNPRGLLIFNDELRSFFNSFGAYSHSKGKAELEKSFYDECYDVTPADISTITHDTISIPRPFLNIYGGIQPQIFKKISKDDMASGSLQRWMFFLYIKKPQYYKHYELSDKSQKLIECLYQYCTEFDFVNNEPVVVKLSKEAEKQFAEYYNKFEDLQVQNHIPEFNGFLSKCPERIAKIAFILEVIDSFLNNKSPDSLLLVTKKSVDKAYLIVDWFTRQNEMLWSYSLYNDYILNPKSIDIELCHIILNLTKTLGYRIPIKDIQENLKRKGFNKSDKAIHKILRDFGFQKYRDSKTRGVEVGQDVLEKIKSFLNKVSQVSQVSQTANSPTITTSYLSDTLVTHSEKSVNVSQMKNEQTEKLTKVSFSLDGIL